MGYYTSALLVASMGMLKKISLPKLLPLKKHILWKWDENNEVMREAPQMTLRPELTKSYGDWMHAKKAVRHRERNSNEAPAKE